MRFGFKQGLIWVPVTLQYEGVIVEVDNCILDTGSASTAIDIDLIDFNYQKPAHIKRLRGLGGGTQEVVCQEIDLFKIGNQEFRNIEVEFGDIKADFGINGFIGTDILSRLTLTIDFRKQTITLDS